MDKSMLILLFIVAVALLPVLEAQDYRLEAFVSTDSPIYRPGSFFTAEVFVFPIIDLEFEAEIRFSFTNLPNAPQIPPLRVKIPPVSRSRFIKFESETVRLPVNVGDGTYYLRMEVFVGGRRILEDTVDFWIRSGPPSGWKPMVLFVWHNHQGPNYRYGLDFFSNWHIIHFYGDAIGVYYRLSDVYPNVVWNDMGTYYLHYYLLTKYRNVKVNHHFSPSLIYQLYIAATQGFTMRAPNGTRISVDPNHPLARVVFDFFEGLVRLSNEGRVYLMTSCFAHTIMGYYMDRYDVSELIKYDIELGMEWTKILLTDTDAIWTPEMAWSDKLIPIYLDLGLRITVLDGTHHFPGASGDKGTIWEPYIIRDRAGRELVVFFRDQVVSDRDIGFTNMDWDRARNADRDARQLYYNIYNIHSFKNYDRRPIHVLAADGENWMLFSPSVANGALFLERIYRYIDRMSQSDIDIMDSGTFADALKVSPPRRELTSIPSTSWLGGWGKWTVEKGRDHVTAWSLMDEAMDSYKGLLRVLEVNDYQYFKSLLTMNRAFNESVVALIHAMDSDYWWAEFFSMGYIRSWLDVFHEFKKDALGIDIKIHIPGGNVFRRTVNEAVVRVTNRNVIPLRGLYVEVRADGVNRTTSPLSLAPHETKEVRLNFRPITPMVNITVTVYLPEGQVSPRRANLYAVTQTFRTLKAVDFAVRLSILSPAGEPIEDVAYETGTYRFVVTIMADEEPEVDIAVNYTLMIGRFRFERTIVFPRGSRTRTDVLDVNIPEFGTYGYVLTIAPQSDINNLNNAVSGELRVIQRQKGLGIAIPIVVAVVAASIAAALFIVFKGRAR